MSRHTDIADAVKDVIVDWANTNWTDAHVERGRVFDALCQLINDTRPIVIGVMAPTVEPEDVSARDSDTDVITVNVVVLVRANGITNTVLDPIDDNVEALRDHLRKFHEATVDSVEFQLNATWKLDTAYDHGALNTSELWASMLSAEYSVDVDTSPEVPQI